MKKLTKYMRIENDIREDITLQRLKMNEQIMTEEQLCEKYRVSRMTANKAISNLVAKGYIRRVPGKGSFVRNPHISKQVGISRSFTDDMLSMGLNPGSRLIEYSVKRASEIPDVAEKLSLSPCDLIHFFIRLRTGDDLPIAISYTYVSSLCIPAVDISCLEKSFYEYVASLGLEIGDVEGEFTATLPNEDQKEHLGIRDEALLLYSHTTYMKDGRAMEYIRTYYVGSRYSYCFKSCMRGEI